MSSPARHQCFGSAQLTLSGTTSLLGVQVHRSFWDGFYWGNKTNKPKGSSDTFLTLFALLEFLFNNPITHGLKLLQQTFSAGSYLLISPGVNQKYHLFVNGWFFFSPENVLSYWNSYLRRKTLTEPKQPTPFVSRVKKQSTFHAGCGKEGATSQKPLKQEGSQLTL